ncbi:hypothetical protein G7Y79_00024g055680 [Physcia stellaris]|nr:hypothetical protein G7Y79_00024g055680 [Physcia stellaris]
MAAEIIKRKLEESLSGLKVFGSFATSGKVPGDVSTGLSVHGVGRIAFPLLEHQAKEVINVCHQAPFGKGSETRIDESVRKTWELNSEQFDLCNPSWPSIVNQITEKASRELGCAPEVTSRASLYKLLLYEKGAMFKPHKDTEKEPGMYGTLVICLPSEYQGGAVVTTHCAKSKTLKIELPEFFHSYMSWYADVTHEVKPITSGYRLVLVYNLIQDSHVSSPSAALTVGEKMRLEMCYDRGIRPARKYTDASLSLQALKGEDRVKAEYLRETCAEAGVCFYLASMEHTKYGSVENNFYDDDSDEDHSAHHHTLEDVIEEELSLKRVVDLHGHLLARNVAINEEDIVEEDPFDGRDPDHEDYEGYTGNAGASATHWYHDTVLVLVPLSGRQSLFSIPQRRGDVNFSGWVLGLIDSVTNYPDDSFSRRDLAKLCHFALRDPAKASGADIYLRTNGNEIFQAPDSSLLIRASILLADLPLFEQAIIKEFTASLEVYQHIGVAMFIFKLQVKDPTINGLIDNLSAFHARFRALTGIEKGFEQAAREHTLMDDARVQDLKAWVRGRSIDAFQTMKTVIRDDGISMVDLARKEPETIKLSDCLNVAEPSMKNTAFVTAFATRLMSAYEEGKIDKQQANETHQVLLQSLCQNFSVECVKYSKRMEPGTDQLGDVECLTNADDVDLLMYQLNAKDMLNGLLQIMKQLLAEAKTCDTMAFEAFYLLLLKHLITRINAQPNLLEIYRPLFSRVLSLYICRYVQIEPPAANLSRDREGCGRCSDCHTLDKFLVDPKLKSRDFPVSKSRRHHLHEMLNDTRHSHETDRYRGDTLVVTKASSSSDRKHTEWKKRFARAQEQIQSFDQKALQNVLGEMYETIVELRSARRGAKAQPSLSHPRPGQQTQLHIIDLT